MRTYAPATRAYGALGRGAQAVAARLRAAQQPFSSARRQGYGCPVRIGAPLPAQRAGRRTRLGMPDSSEEDGTRGGSRRSPACAEHGKGN
jgi:hypothetical protein